ncbi:MAG: NAD(P)H-dependent glycerol-3-phosphate dehydrogenase [Deltaproteobacteria bacterium]|nr:NAD(P)H-dependent glycerol-3-phosphate dehydrogenase [Deltaproteobacteria bacterium]MBW2420155.1 NAD(P)H-dependent glycerol-3-phosphate dehydrogenase [Deltaproteobacteria bacterium]
MKMRVTVLGAGSWGTTVANIAAANAPTRVWARNPEAAREINEQHSNERYLPAAKLHDNLRATADLEEAVREADALVIGIPSHGFREILETAAPHVRPWVPIVSLTKGLEQGSMLRMSQIIEELMPDHPAAVLTGPNLAREIVDGKAAASVIAVRDLKVAAALQRVFTKGLFRVYTNHDVIGCELGGALKNVIAIATGMAEALMVGDNTRSLVITRGLAELTRLGVAMGGEPATFAGLAGLGDLLATCISQHSRNRYVGEQLGRGRSIEEITAEMHMVAEGVKTSSVVVELAKQYDVEMPIADQIQKVIYEGRDPGEAYTGLRRRPAGHESESG